METIYLIVLALGIIGGSFYYFPFFICVGLSLIICGITFFYSKKGALIILFILSIFLYRGEKGLLKSEIQRGDIVKVLGKVQSGKGKIEKINGKRVLERGYFLVDKIEDGRKSILGTVESIKRDSWGVYYKLSVDEVSEEYNIIREYLERKIDRITENYSFQLRSLYKGVVLGDRESINRDLIKKFREIGVSHLLVISGLHIGLVISGTIIFLNLFNLKKETRYILALIILTVYIFGIGSSPSVLRAYIMGVIYLLGNILYEKVHSGRSLCLAFIISLLIYPHWIYEISFIMSYIAVVAIVYVYPKISRKKGKIKEGVLLALVIQICMTPVTLIYFKQIQILAFISNLILIPIGSTFILMSFFTLFLSMFYLEFLVAPILNLSYLIFMKSVELVGYIPYLTLEL